MFLIAFTCAVASVSSASTFQCSDRTHVQLAAVRPVVAAGAVPETLVAQTLRCQGFDTKGAGQLIATCRFVGGADVGCAMVDKGLATEVAHKQRQYELPSCAQRAALRG
jgi:endonuclease YncB( thermonuclease family)